MVKDSSRSVFVRNLPFEATYEDVASFFSQAGEVSCVSCVLVCWWWSVPYDQVASFFFSQAGEVSVSLVCCWWWWWCLLVVEVLVGCSSRPGSHL